MPKAYSLTFEEIEIYKPVINTNTTQYQNNDSCFPSKQDKFAIFEEARKRGLIPDAKVIRTHHASHGKYLQPENIGTIVKYQIDIQPNEFVWYPILVRFIEKDNRVTEFGYHIKDLVLYDPIKKEEDSTDYGHPFY